MTERLGPVGAGRPRLADDVHRDLLGRLLSHELQPGARLTVDALSRELGVSQTPIREALNRLEAGGVVVRTHLAGYRVAPPLTREELDDLVEVRLLLEPVAARRAAERMSPEGVAHLRELATAMDPAQVVAAGEGAGHGHDHAVFAERDAAFHDAVAAGSGSRAIRECLLRLHVHVRMFRLGVGGRIRSEALEEHAAVVGAVAAGDGPAAQEAMRRHLQRSAERFAAAFEDR